MFQMITSILTQDCMSERRLPQVTFQCAFTYINAIKPTIQIKEGV